MGKISAWSEISAKIRQRVGRAAYREWFRNLTARGEDHALVVECPDAFTLHWIRGHYGPVFEDVAKADFAEIRYELAQIAPNEDSKGRRGAPSARRLAPRSAAAPAVAAADGPPAGGAATPLSSRAPGPLAEPLRAAVAPPTLAAPAPGPARVARARASRRPQADAGAVPRRLEPSFASFVVGPHNALAAEAARALAQGQSDGISPLFLTSVPGGGKSHLCRSIERAAAPGALYCSSEQFTTEVTQAMRSGNMEAVHQRYRRSVNVLILEDVQFLNGKRATQIELFHTLDHLMQHGKPVVFSADRAPAQIDGLDRRLVSRMAGGLVARIGMPDVASASRLLADKVARGGMRIPDACLEVLAQRPVSSVRELIAGLNQVVARATLLGRAIDLDLLRETLDDVDLPRPRRTIAEIMELTARVYSLGIEDLCGPSRQRSVVRARQFAMYLCRCYTDASLKQIGLAFHRDHTSVLHSVRVVEKRNLEQAQHRYEFEALAGRLGAPSARP